GVSRWVVACPWDRYNSIAERYRDHRHLLSFPIRRCSDLMRRQLAQRIMREHLHVDVGQRHAAPRHRRDGLQQGLGLVDVQMLTRSEEHTSELQSQSKLVCRLLLEKKKKTHTQSRHSSYRT